MGKLKDQLAGIAALIAAVVAIGGGFVKYGEITTKLNLLQKASMKIDKVSIEMSPYDLSKGRITYRYK